MISIVVFNVKSQIDKANQILINTIFPQDKLDIEKKLGHWQITSIQTNHFNPIFIKLVYLATDKYDNSSVHAKRLSLKRLLKHILVD